MPPILRRITSLTESIIFRAPQVLRYFGRSSSWRLFRKAAEKYQRSVYRVAWRAFRLYMLERFTPDEVVQRGLADPEWPLTRYREHLCDARLHGLQGRINPTLVSVCRDKMAFHSHCTAHNLPVPKLYAILSHYGSRTDAYNPISLNSEAAFQRLEYEHLPDSVVLKPRTGNKGRDVRVLDKCQRSESPENSRAQQLLRVKARLSPEGDDWLIEEALLSESRIAALTGKKAVSSVRIVTFVENGIVEVVAGYFRVLVGDSVTDNISKVDGSGRSGNILGSIDMTSGDIIDAFRFCQDGIGVEYCISHPDTNREIVGFTVPRWGEVVELVIKAAQIFQPIVTIGWDVAITPHGPVLIEANEKYQWSGIGNGTLCLRERLEEMSSRSVVVGGPE